MKNSHSQPLDVEIRHYTPADIPKMLHVIQQAFAPQIGIVDPPPSATRKTVAVLEAELKKANAFVALLKNELVGCVLFEPQGGGLYFGRLAVLPSVQRRGIAQRLITAVEAEARVQNVPFLSLAVRVALTHQQAFYARLGFEIIGYGTHKGFSAPTFIKMKKMLA